MIDLSDPTLDERLRRRNAEGHYEISEKEIILTVRSLQASGQASTARMLAETLLERCTPAFLFHSKGLSHRPDLREEAVANMNEHLLREMLNPDERFMIQNFVHYLRCLCADEFKRVLRQEGLHYRRDTEGRPAGRPQHVPRALMEPLQTTNNDETGPISADVADPHDQFEQMHAEDESQRILTYLSDPLDRSIMVLRAMEEMKWDDIAKLCARTERTVRSRYQRACDYLRTRMAEEEPVAYSSLASTTMQQHS